MASGENGSGLERKLNGDDLAMFNAENLQSNSKVVYYRFEFFPACFVTICDYVLGFGSLEEIYLKDCLHVR